MGNDSIIAFRTREQLRKLRNYLGVFSPQFRNSRWKMEFLGQMLFGIQASRDTLVSEIARSLQEDILAKKTQERLERHLATEGMHVAKVSRKMFKVPEFFYCAIADGLRWLFVRHGRWRGWKCPREECGDLQMEFELLSG